MKNIKNDDVIVTVSGFSGGWFEISKAEDGGGETIFKIVAGFIRRRDNAPIW